MITTTKNPTKRMTLEEAFANLDRNVDVLSDAINILFDRLKILEDRARNEDESAKLKIVG